MYRRALPKPARNSTLRNIPPEPDDLWDAIAVQARIAELLARLKVTLDPSLAIGLLREKRRDEELLGRLLEKGGLDPTTFRDRLASTPAVVYAVKLAQLDAEEAVDARKATYGDDFEVSIYGRGFAFMHGLELSGEYTTATGTARVFPMTRAGELSDVTGIQFTAGLRPADIGFVKDGVVTLITRFTLMDETVTRRAVERFVVG